MNYPINQIDGANVKNIDRVSISMAFSFIIVDYQAAAREHPDGIVWK